MKSFCSMPIVMIHITINFKQKIFDDTEMYGNGQC